MPQFPTAGPTFSFAVVCVTAENCTLSTIVTDCSHEICGNGFRKDCVRNLCTCSGTNFFDYVTSCSKIVLPRFE